MEEQTYSLDLTEDEWNVIICLVWLEHDFELSNKIRRELLKKYPDFKDT